MLQAPTVQHQHTRGKAGSQAMLHTHGLRSLEDAAAAAGSPRDLGVTGAKLARVWLSLRRPGQPPSRAGGGGAALPRHVCVCTGALQLRQPRTQTLSCDLPCQTSFQKQAISSCSQTRVRHRVYPLLELSNSILLLHY